jgi:hypothetical protein
MTFQPELLDELLKGYQKPEDLMGEGGILKQLGAKVAKLHPSAMRGLKCLSSKESG